MKLDSRFTWQREELISCQNRLVFFLLLLIFVPEDVVGECITQAIKTGQCKKKKIFIPRYISEIWPKNWT